MQLNTFKPWRFVYYIPCTRLQNCVNVSPLSATWLNFLILNAVYTNKGILKEMKRLHVFGKNQTVYKTFEFVKYIERLDYAFV